MIVRIVVFTCALLVARLVTPCPAKTGENEWERGRNQHGVQVFTRSVEGYSIKEFRGETVIQAPVEVAFEALNDTERAHEWFGDCLRQERICQINDFSKIIYHVVAVPILKNRDLVARVEFNPDFQAGTLFARIQTLTREDVPDTCLPDGWVPESSNFVRITRMMTTFDFRQLDPHSTRIIFTVLVDPAGRLPSWISNYFAKENPVTTLSGFSEIVKRPIYWQQASARHGRPFEAPGGTP